MQNWSVHIKKAKVARITYKEHTNKDSEEEEIIFSVDLEKAITLPRCEIDNTIICSPFNRI